jgi:hypothetical protein
MSILQVEGAACQRGSGSVGKGRKDNVDHNCLCQSILAILAKGQAFTILGPRMTSRIELIY